MFTGIIVAQGRVTTVCGDEKAGLSLDIFTDLAPKDLALGASVACNGVCLTVVNYTHQDSGHVFRVDVSPETLSVTTLGQWAVGQEINLEPALRVGDALGGHWVTGHVDGIGQVKDIVPAGDGHERWFIACPDELMGYIACRGSVAVDGCSLTVVEIGAGYFVFNMIPHTRKETSFHQYGKDTPVHLEVDILARYAARWKEVHDD